MNEKRDFIKKCSIWGDATSDIIKKIYVCEKDTIIREITKEELLNMEV